MKTSFKNVGSLIALKTIMLSGMAFSSKNQEDVDFEKACANSLVTFSEEQNSAMNQMLKSHNENKIKTVFRKALNFSLDVLNNIFPLRISYNVSMHLTEKQEDTELKRAIQASKISFKEENDARIDLKQAKHQSIAKVVLDEQARARELGMTVSEYKAISSENIKIFKTFEEAQSQSALKMADEEQTIARELGITVGDYRVAVKENAEIFKNLKISRISSSEEFITDVDSFGLIQSDLSRINHKKLVFQETSGENNNCLLHSMMDGNLELVTKVLGDRELAQIVLDSGKFDIIRHKFLDDISKSLDKPLQNTTFRSIIEDMRLEGLDQKYVGLTTEEYLQMMSTNESFLNIGYSDIFSHLYDVPVYVLTPQYDKNKSLLSLANGNYVELPNKAESIFVLHRGFGGAHYSRLKDVS